MKKIFLTGATGVMGSSGLKELTGSPERYEITVLARDSKKNRKQLASYIMKGVRVIWGDLLDAEAIGRGVVDADIVLHVGGMVSPAADWQPQKTIDTNVGSMSNIIAAALPRKEEVKVVYIGSVSQYGSRQVPDHWGECGDPLRATPFDAYAYSKTESERILMESDLKWWVSLRQTGILHSGLLNKASDPISFHVPLKGVLEWVTAEDSGRLLERVCRDSVPDSFWNRCYNIGGGAGYRLTNYEFVSAILKAMGCPPPEKIFNTNWFATDNFHGMWFSDSDYLDELLHFRSGVSIEEYFMQMKKELPRYFSLAPLAPAFAIKAFMKKVATTPKLGPLWWIKNNVTPRINSAWGNRENWESLPDWDSIDISRPSDSNPRPVNGTSLNGSNPEERNVFKCETCGHTYTLKNRTYAFGHRCPRCSKAKTQLDFLINDK